MLPSGRLVHTAADGDFVICRNAPCIQVLLLRSQQLVLPAADVDFVICLVMYLVDKSLCCQTDI